MPTRTTALAAAGIATLALTLTGCAEAGTGTTGSPASSASAPSSAVSGSAGSGSAGDIAFAQLMIPHHQQALDMAVLAETRAASPQVKALAAQIEAAQDPEIAQMSDWLTSWGAPESMPGADGAEDLAVAGHSGHDMGGMTSGGMMAAEEMDALAKATGADFDTMWLEMMIAHHQGAITMAQQVRGTTQDPDVQALAGAVIAGQSAEIDTMQQLLADSAG